jgi:hypothetical protein
LTHHARNWTRCAEPRLLTMVSTLVADSPSSASGTRHCGEILGIDRHYRPIDRVQVGCFNGSRWSTKRRPGGARLQPPHAGRDLPLGGFDSVSRRWRRRRGDRGRPSGSGLPLAVGERDRGTHWRRDCGDCPMQLDRCYQRCFTTRADCGNEECLLRGMGARRRSTTFHPRLIIHSEFV